MSPLAGHSYLVRKPVMPTPTLAAWHDLVRTPNTKAPADLLANDVVFHSPVVHTPQVGKAIMLQYLSAAFHVFFNELFQHVRELMGPSDAVLESVMQIYGTAVNGLDTLTWNDDGLITEFKVMVRPLKAINLIHQKMGALLRTQR